MVPTVSEGYLDERGIVSWRGFALGFFSGALVAGGLLTSGLALALTLLGILVLADCILSRLRAEQHHGTVMVAAILGGIAEVLLFIARTDLAFLILSLVAVILVYLAGRIKPLVTPKPKAEQAKPSAPMPAKPGTETHR